MLQLKNGIVTKIEADRAVTATIHGQTVNLEAYTPVDIAPKAQAVTRINAGGTEFTDSQLRTWSADAYFSGGVTSSKSFDVAGTTDDRLYLSYRYASSGAPFSYSIPVSGAGSYRVKLHFQEPYFGSPGGGLGGTGKRVFHVAIEGKEVLSEYDTYLEDGPGKAVVKTFDDVSMSDGTLNIAFTSVADNAIVSAIEILKVSAEPALNQMVAKTSAASAKVFEGNELHGLELRVYPNPGLAGKVNVEIKGLSKNEVVSVTMHDALGRHLRSLTLTSDKKGVSRALVFTDKGMSRGVYFIRVSAASGTKQSKLVVE